MKKTYSEYIRYIKYMLGAVGCNEDSLEFLNDDLTEYVKIAFSEILPYISARERITLPWNNGFNGAIVLSDFKIRAKSVTAVKRGSPQGYINGGATLFGTWSSYSITVEGTYPNIPIFSLGGAVYAGRGSADNDPWSLEKSMIKAINETSGDKHFIFDYGTQLLFINFNSATSQSTTIDYIPEYRSAEDVGDDYWTMILQKKALAVTKLALSQ
nr:hypothetical protein DGKKSRWO_DGKKSRWO_CDS_0048 [uncultured phage]CAI9752195.1 hypothetical protein CVNMHQAP_CVNMHQAP_CDS_0048 [uncultured phage]